MRDPALFCGKMMDFGHMEKRRSKEEQGTGETKNAGFRCEARALRRFYSLAISRVISAANSPRICRPISMTS